MGRGALVLYLNTPENAEVAGGAGIPFEAGELWQRSWKLVLRMPDSTSAPNGAGARWSVWPNAIAGTPSPISMKMWRTHSCVPRSHSCER